MKDTLWHGFNWAKRYLSYFYLHIYYLIYITFISDKLFDVLCINPISWNIRFIKVFLTCTSSSVLLLRSGPLLISISCGCNLLLKAISQPNSWKVVCLSRYERYLLAQLKPCHNVPFILLLTHIQYTIYNIQYTICVVQSMKGTFWLN